MRIDGGAFVYDGRLYSGVVDRPFLDRKRRPVGFIIPDDDSLGDLLFEHSGEFEDRERVVFRIEPCYPGQKSDIAVSVRHYSGKDLVSARGTARAETAPLDICY